MSHEVLPMVQTRASCRGTGGLTVAAGRTIQCSFELHQTGVGNIYLRCWGQDLEPIPDFQPPESFSGTTDDGRSVAVQGVIHPKTADAGPDGQSRMTYLCQGGEPWRITAGNSTPKTIRFRIVNFLFYGTVWSGGPSTADRRLVLEIDVDGVRLVFDKEPEYEAIETSLKEGGVAVSCTVSVTLGDPADVFGVIEVLDRVCFLLSLARKNLVAWSSYQALDGDGNVIEEVRRTPIGRSFQGTELILNNDGLSTKRFVETGYRVLQQLEPDVQLRRVIHAVVDASTVGFIETKALLTCALCEFLVDRYGALHGYKARSFREYLGYASKQLQTGLKAGDLSAFVASRDSLTHEMRFHTPDRVKELRQLAYVVDLLLLRLLGYSGHHVRLGVGLVVLPPTS